MAKVRASLVTLREMLVDRGLDVGEFVDIDDVVSRSANQQVLSFDLPSCDIRIVYCLGQKYNNRDVKKVLNEQSAASNVNHAILVTQESPTSGSQVLTTDKPQIKSYEVFKLTTLCSNISKHALQPKFELMTEAEVQELLEKSSTKRKKLPAILTEDPMAKYYGLKPNDVVRIVRKTPNGESYYYRCCYANKPQAAAVQSTVADRLAGVRGNTAAAAAPEAAEAAEAEAAAGTPEAPSTPEPEEPSTPENL